MGDFELVGPHVADYICTIGQDCHVTVHGYRLEMINTMIMGAYAECGEPGFRPASISFSPVGVTSKGSNASYILGMPEFGYPGDFYNLCWGWNPQQWYGGGILHEWNIGVDRSFTLEYQFARRLRGLEKPWPFFEIGRLACSIKSYLTPWIDKHLFLLKCKKNKNKQHPWLATPFSNPTFWKEVPKFLVFEVLRYWTFGKRTLWTGLENVFSISSDSYPFNTQTYWTVGAPRATLQCHLPL